MKTLSLLIIALLCTIGAIAQPWSEPTAGSIYYQGNVGIGTTEPGAKLDVRDGNFVLTDADIIQPVTGNLPATAFGQLSAISGTDGGLRIIGQTDADASGLILEGTMGVADPTDTTPAVVFRADKWNGGISTVALADAETAFQFWNRSTTNLLTIKGNGNVGIGTTTPEAKLTVKGKIVASEIQVKDIGVIADYVFKPDYQLMSLEKVEDFVKQNQHLPEVPSEKEFKKDGMNVAEMNALLLKKVEELTLYSIEQNKSLKEQAKKIEALEKAMNNSNPK